MKIKYYIFCIRWLWKNRNWTNTRQKFKAMVGDWENVKLRKNHINGR